MKKLYLFLLFPLLIGCVSIPEIDFDSDPRVQEIKRLSIPAHPYLVSVSPLELDRKLELEVQRGRLIEAGEDAEKISRQSQEGEKEYRYSLPFEEDKFRNTFSSFLKDQKIFSQVLVQLGKKASLQQQLKKAWEDNCDLLVQFKVNRYEVYYNGINAWYVPNLALWALFIFPAWFVPDESYGAKFEMETRVYSVHSGLPVFERTYKADIQRSLDDFDRGYQILGILRVPGSLGPSNWRTVESALMPYGLHEIKKKMYGDLKKEFRDLRMTPQFQSSMSKQMALVIGVSRYKDFYIPKLQFAHQDAKGLYQKLLQGGYTSQSAKILQDEYATLENVKKAFAELESRARKGDTVMIYFSGRALVGKDLSSSYLLFFDSKGKELKKTALSLRDVSGWLKKIKSQKVVLCMDTSFSGDVEGRSLKSPQGGGGFDFKKFLSRPGLVVLSGASMEESAYELRELRGGIFSYSFIEALSGKGDINPRDGKVTLQEVYDYVREEVPRLAGLEGLSQHPLWNGAIPGEVTLFIKDKSAAKLISSTDKKAQGKIEGKVLGIELEK